MTKKLVITLLLIITAVATARIYSYYQGKVSNQLAPEEINQLREQNDAKLQELKTSVGFPLLLPTYSLAGYVVEDVCCSQIKTALNLPDPNWNYYSPEKLIRIWIIEHPITKEDRPSLDSYGFPKRIPRYRDDLTERVQVGPHVGFLLYTEKFGASDLKFSTGQIVVEMTVEKYGDAILSREELITLAASMR